MTTPSPLPPLPPLKAPSVSVPGAVLALLVPGLGHWWIGRARRGLLLFVAGTLGVNLVFIAVVFDPADGMSSKIYAGIPLALGAWLASVIDGLRLAWFVRRPRIRARRQDELAQGTAALAADDWKTARAAFARATADDDCDPAALLGLARAELLGGHAERAAGHVRRALRATGGAKYRTALKAELALARAAITAGPI